MFKKYKNIDTAFRYMRLVCVVLCVCCAVVSVFSILRSYTYVAAAQGKIYVLYNGKVLEAYAAERKDNIPVEARDHIATFMRYFFTLDPDEKSINGNVEKGLYLADASAKKLYDNMKESGFYANIIAANISQSVTVDSIAIDMGAYPWYFRCYATESLVRPTNITTRNLVSEGYLRNVARSDHNSHGFLIERFEIIENNNEKTINR